MERRPIREDEIVQAIVNDSVAVSQYVSLIRRERHNLTTVELLHDYV